jgi:hypothetical protein
MLTGEAEPMDTMGTDDADMDMEPTTDMEGGDDMDIDVDDDEFGAADTAAGGEAPMGREKRESVQYSKKKLK